MQKEAYYHAFNVRKPEVYCRNKQWFPEKRVQHCKFFFCSDKIEVSWVESHARFQSLMFVTEDFLVATELLD